MTFNIEAGRAWFESLPKYEEPKGFKAWMAKVEAILERKTGLSSSDLPDFLYLDEYEDGATPAQAAAAAIRAAK